MNTEIHPPSPSTTALTTTTQPTQKPQPKRFIRNQIPQSLLTNPSLNAAISLLPQNYNFEIHKSIHRIQTLSSTLATPPRVALQLPEGLLMYSLTLSDIFRSFAGASEVFVLADVTYGACCVDDLSAASLGAHLLIHYGHSCLVPVDNTVIPCLYVFVEIGIDVRKLVETVKRADLGSSNFAVAGTIQFSSAVRAAKVELEALGFRVLVPQSKPLSAGEVLGCTAPTVSIRDFGINCKKVSEIEKKISSYKKNVSENEEKIENDNKNVSENEEKIKNESENEEKIENYKKNGSKNEEEEEEEFVIVFVADGRFHLEAFMIANPGVRAYRYDPYLGRLFLEEYDQEGMKKARKAAIVKARGAREWGIVLGTLGRQGNPRILERLERKMEEKGMSWMIVLMSEISPARINLFEGSVDAWIQIACPRLSIDWGEAFERTLLNPYEAEIALGLMPGWWERNEGDGGRRKCGDCGCGDGSENGAVVKGVDYPMDYYSQDGGEWNSSYMKGKSRPSRRNLRTSVSNGSVS